MSAVEVPIGDGLVALVDAEDAHRVLAARWRRRRNKRFPLKLYVQRSFRAGGRKYTETLHRFILGCQPGDGLVVDHISGDTLDNRRCNLRLTGKRGNGANITSSKNQKSGGYKGVHWNRRAGKWQVTICGGPVRANGKRKSIYLGLYTDAVEAARVYDAAALQAFGEFAALNFPLARSA